MKIFLSYSSKDREVADEVHMALTGDDHEVFFDKDSLPAGGDYHERIRQAVGDSDIFVFLISPSSVASGSYALTELKYARAKWPHPRNRVLPVRLRAVDWETIPAYLKAVTVLEPEGSIAAETLTAVAQMAHEVRAAAPIAADQDVTVVEPSSSRIKKTQKITAPILVAVLGILVVLGATAITSWDKLFPGGARRGEPASDQKATPDHPSTPSEVFNLLRQSVVLVHVEGVAVNRTKWWRESSGFFVSKDGKLLTVSYALQSFAPEDVTRPERMSVKVAADPAGPWKTATVLTIHKNLQLALLQVTDQVASSPASFSPHGVMPGDALLLVGYPGQSTATLLQGPVANVGPKQFVVSAAASAGFAGAPVVDITGKVVGVAVGSSGGPGTVVLPGNLALGFIRPYLPSAG